MLGSRLSEHTRNSNEAESPEASFFCAARAFSRRTSRRAQIRTLPPIWKEGNQDLMASHSFKKLNLGSEVGVCVGVSKGETPEFTQIGPRTYTLFADCDPSPKKTRKTCNLGSNTNLGYTPKLRVLILFHNLIVSALHLKLNRGDPNTASEPEGRVMTNHGPSRPKIHD